MTHHSLLEHSDALNHIADFVTEKVMALPTLLLTRSLLTALAPPQIKKLGAATAESGEALNAKFVEEFHSDEMAFGGQESFFKGLDRLIGPPNPNLLEGMRSEHRR